MSDINSKSLLASILDTQGVMEDLLKSKQRIRELEAQLAETTNSYETVKAWGHRVSGSLETLLDRCCDYADGTPDSTDLAKFCNEMIGVSNSISLGDIQTLRAERDALKAQLAAPNTKLSFEEWFNSCKEAAVKLGIDIEGERITSESAWNACKENFDITQIKWPVVNPEDIQSNVFYICAWGKVNDKQHWALFQGAFFIMNPSNIAYGPIPMPTKGVE